MTVSLSGYLRKSWLKILFSAKRLFRYWLSRDPTSSSLLYFKVGTTGVNVFYSLT